MTIEDGGDLAGDLACGEVAADAQLGGETELAVDGAANLTGDADGGAAIGEGDGILFRCDGIIFPFFLLFFLGGLRAVAAFASVAVGHPDGLDGLAVGHADEVALGAVDGAGGLNDLRETYGVAFGVQEVAEVCGQSGDVVDGCNPLTVKGVLELGGSVGGLVEGLRNGGKFGQGQAGERSGRGDWFSAVFWFV